MRPRLRVWLAVSLAAIACSLLGASGAAAAIEPPWCGTPMPDAAESLPDGTDPADPPGSFPHIPYYAIGCTLQDIASRSGGRMEIEVIGQSALGRDMYKVTINALGTRAQRNDFARLQRVIGLARRNPRRAQKLIERRDLKVPVFIQGSIHGNEYEGVDAVMRTIERVATTPYGEDPQVDAWLDHAVLVFNVIQNPDGRIAGTRTNSNGFDLNRDYITQSQPETVASVGVIREWFPTGVYDLHGYVTPTLVEGTTVPHNPGIEYDIWTKWNQPRMDANQAGLASEGFGITRPIDNIPGESRRRLDPRGRDAAPRLGRLGPVLHRPVRPAARARRDDRRGMLRGRRRRHAGSTARRLPASAGPARCASTSSWSARRSTSSSRTAARCSTTSTRSIGAARRTRRVPC